MTLLLDIAPYLAPVPATATGDEIYRRFEHEPDTLAICVIDDGERPIGLVERNAFLVAMAAQHGHALWATRPVQRIMKTDPVIADGEVTVAEFCGRLLKERPSELLHGFIVTRAGRYAGVGNMLSLLQVSAAAAEAASHQAQEALAARSRFLAVMSHEIRTPLNGVLAVAEILRRRSSQPDLEPLIDTIVDSGGVLGRLLNDALDLSRAEARALDLDEAPVRVSDLADSARSLWTPQAELRGVPLSVRYEGEAESWVLADQIRLNQVLNNLISNALKFTGPTGVEATICARPDPTDTSLVRLSITVADSGPGVPPELREAIFAPFQQTDEGFRRGGAGLGLAVCRQIVDRMGGDLRVIDNPGGGALFCCEGSLRFASAPPKLAASAEEFETSAVAAHVLIVDDNPTNLLVASNLCEIFGCTSECVGDGAAAVAAVLRGNFDLILMDIHMPGMDGVQATRAIRALNGAVSHVPIIALTANADRADALLYRRSGFDGVVAKPIVPAQLLSTMNDVLTETVIAEPELSVA